MEQIDSLVENAGTQSYRIGSALVKVVGVVMAGTGVISEVVKNSPELLSRVSFQAESLPSLTGNIGIIISGTLLFGLGIVMSRRTREIIEQLKK
ncbi:hypothetical protein JW766_01945 [Candidatus Dojkabacteria bacterium]|nr:hypothetical protein [Candidatus Dojkabacteria bacterium]